MTTRTIVAVVLAAVVAVSAPARIGSLSAQTVDCSVAAVQAKSLSGQAPGAVPASHATDGKIDRTRPLCPYPQMARYTGKGSIDEAVNFVCK